MQATGEARFYGQNIGILMLDTFFPRIVGDIGNALTFPFPVNYKIVRTALPTRVVLENDPTLLPLFIDAAKELVAEGAKAITTSCGFLAFFQQELAVALPVPVFTSSLLQVPLAERLIRPDQRVVIVTANRKTLSPRHLAGAGIRGGNYGMIGLEDKPEFFATFVQQKLSLDLEAVSEEIYSVAREIKEQFPDTGAVVLECTNLPPFRHIFQAATGCPVFDIVTLTYWLHASLACSPGIKAGI